MCKGTGKTMASSSSGNDNVSGRFNDEISQSRLRFQMKTALQNIGWTYSVFWKFSPQQGILVWNNGFFNGDFKTNEIGQGMEEELHLQEEMHEKRTLQLRELFESLSARGSSSLPTRQQYSLLSPEDLTDTEWFYLTCMSYDFRHSVGLPGITLERGNPMWLSNAGEAHTKIFKRHLLAKSSGIQTVVCLPFTDGVLEFGVTELVHEDRDLIEHITSFFVDLL
uniref:Transcription factor MYC/MYB N-terminal domain-containing protein n=1 Tax=Picea sitchensis TaxID=3332 RepID=D5ACI9_PICSI|nr:unknown [Picea sitchensis]